MPPKKEFDLNKVFKLEGMLEPRSPRSDSRKIIESKKPQVLSEEVRALLDEMEKHVNEQNLDKLIECLDAAQARIEVMTKSATIIRDKLSKGRKKK